MNLERLRWLHQRHRVRCLRRHGRSHRYTVWQKLVVNTTYGPLTPGGGSFNYPSSMSLRLLSSQKDDFVWIDRMALRRQVLGMNPKIAMKPPAAKLP